MGNAVWKTIIVLMLALLLAEWIWSPGYLMLVAGALGAISLMFPVLAEWIHIGWMKLAQALGWFNGRLLLSLVFFLLLTPIALIYRLFNRDSLRLKRPKEGESMFVERNHTFSASDLSNPW